MMTPRRCILLALLLCPQRACSLAPHGKRLRALRWTVRSPVCAADGESEEVAKARRRRDEQAVQAEWQEGLAQNAQTRDAFLREDELMMLKERIELVETKEAQLGEIKDMLRAMGAPLGLQLVNERNEVTASAWVFVALNVLVVLYAANLLLAAPLAKSAALLTSGVD